MEAAEHQQGGAALDFHWAHYGTVPGDGLAPAHHAVPQEVVGGTPPNLPLFTEGAAQQEAGQRSSSGGQPQLNIHSRPKRQPRGSKRYRNEEYVSVPLEEEEGGQGADSAPAGGKRGRAAAAQAVASAGESAAAPAASAAVGPAVSQGAAAPAPQHHYQAAVQMAAADGGGEAGGVGPEAVGYHHHHHAAAEAEHLDGAAVMQAQEQAALMQQMSLQMGGELPLPVVPKLAAKPTEPLNTLAMQTLASQDAASHDQYLKLLRFDDQIAELASRRGLLVRFIIKSVKTYQPQPEMVVEAPEFMTVEYLKRRIMKAKLLRGEFVNPVRFVLRKKLTNDSGELVGMDDVPSREPTGDEIFLFHQGYEAPGPYELFISSAPQTSDREQQDRILGLAHQDSGAVDPSRLSYQQLLQAPGMPGSSGQLAGIPASSAMQMAGGEMPTNSAAMGMEMQGMIDGQQAVSMHSGMMPTGTMPVALPVMDGQQPLYTLPHEEQPTVHTEKSPKPRRQTGRWMPEEVEALIEGVSMFKTSWAQIYERYVVTNKINSKRTQVDLKDKWRNLVKLVTDPNKHARGMDLSEEQRQTILRLVFANDITTTTTGGEQYGTPSADQAAAAAAAGTGQEMGGEAAAAAAAAVAAAGMDASGALPVEAVPMPDMGSAEMQALLQNMYAQYHSMGLAPPDTEMLQAQIQAQLHQQHFLAQQAQHMSPEELAAMQQAQQLSGMEGMDPQQLAALQAQMDPQQFAAYQQQLMAQQAQHQHVMGADMAQYQQVDPSAYQEHYAAHMTAEEAAAAQAAAEQMQQQHEAAAAAAAAMHHQPHGEDAAAAVQLHHQLVAQAAAQAAAMAQQVQQQQQQHEALQQQQQPVDPLQPLTEETLDLPPLAQ